MSKVERLRERARAAEARDPRGAIDAWLEVLRVQEQDGDPNPDLSIYNRIGDLYLKVKDPAGAADYYERGVEKYAELGFHNNAIALCNKVLRNAPGRPTTYLKLAKLYAAKGFLAEARQNFVEYAERMKRAGNVDQAFAALKQVTDLSPDSENLRRMLEEHLRTYGDVQRRPSRQSVAAEPPPEPKVPKRKTSSLVFLDLDEPSPRPAAASAPPPPAPPTPERKRSAEPAPPRAEPPRAAPRAPAPSPGGDIEFVRGLPGEDAEPLEVEPTTAEGADADAGADTFQLEGLQTTSFDFEQVRESVDATPSLREDVDLDTPVAHLGGFEPTVGDEPLMAEETDNAAEYEEAEAEAEAQAGAGAGTETEAEPEVESPSVETDQPAAIEPEAVAPARQGPPAGRRPPAAPPPRREPEPPAPRSRPPIDVPPLDLEPEFETAAASEGHELDDQPLAEGDESLAGWIINSDDADRAPPVGGRSQGYIDLGLDGVTTSDFGAAALAGAAAPPTIEELEARVADAPDDPDAHRALGEALIESGDRERGLEELDHAVSGYEVTDHLQQARDLVDEILRLDPNSVRHRQRAVEYAYRAGSKDQLIEAYLELADALLRSNLPDKAHAVYERVAEHDPANPRAQAALSMLAPAPPPPPTPGRTAARDARMRVRDERRASGEFVDLGALVLGEDEERDTRMRVEDEAPSGDQERDFHDMLARFRQGIDENIDETDFQSHYDLGVAFKEMGLLDEAISEFQKALRAPEGKLRTTEALGVCFFEKGAHSVAESILRRGLELPAGGDQERLGVLYWLGRALEGQGNLDEARDFYGRVFAVDIRFMDVGARVKALARA